MIVIINIIMYLPGIVLAASKNPRLFVNRNPTAKEAGEIFSPRYVRQFSGAVQL